MYVYRFAICMHNCTICAWHCTLPFNNCTATITLQQLHCNHCTRVVTKTLQHMSLGRANASFTAELLVSPVSLGAVCGGTQNVKRYPYFFQVLNIFDTDSSTFCRYQIFPIPVPKLFSNTKFTDTGSQTFSGNKFFRYQFVLILVPIPPPKKKVLVPKKSRYR